MAQVLHLTPLGKPVGAPILLDRRRRRLSTVMARHNQAGRRVIAFKVPNGKALDMERHLVRRRRWKDVLVGPEDMILILPVIAGGGGGRGGAGKGLSIALAVASIALLALGQFWAAGQWIATTFDIGLKAGNAIWAGVSAGLLLGASVLAQSMMQSKANTPKQLYGVSGGGNVARLWERIPVTYGRTWVKPDLTQVDYYFYDGDDVVLVKRLSVGLGKYNLKTIRVGDSVFWTAADGIKPPFDFNLDDEKGAKVEVLYGTASTILPGNVYSSPSVAGIQVARVIDNPARSGPFPVCQPGDKVERIQIDMSWPNGVFTRATKSGNLNAATVNVYWEYREIDDLGEPVGDGLWSELHRVYGAWKSQDPIRRTEIKSVPLARYEVQAYSVDNHQENVSNDVYWDGLRGLFNDTVAREGRTEVVMRVRSSKSLSITSFSNAEMEVARVLDVWDGSAWSEQETSLAKWAAVDILRSSYGSSVPDAEVDLPRFLALSLTQDNEFNATINGPVSVWEALGTALAPIRADVIKIGNLYSFVRDEPKVMRQHAITRRNIVRDSSSITFDLGTDRSAGDVVMEIYRGGDPKDPVPIRSTIGSQSRTPKRMQPIGITDPYHGQRFADYHAAVSAFRQETRDVVVGRDGTLYRPGDLAAVDTWFYSARQATQVDARSNRTLTLDGTPDAAAYPYCVLRDRKGRAFGPMRYTIGALPKIVTLDADDLAAAQTNAGMMLADVMAKPRQNRTIAQFGTLAELQRNYLVKSAVPANAETVRVSLVYDDPRVWAYIGANMPVFVPPSARDPDYPVVLGISAWVNRNDTRLTLHWSARLAADAALTEVQLSYDEGLTWPNIYTGPATNGTAPIGYNENGPCWIRARGIGPNGTPGDWTMPSVFTTPAPSVNGGYLIEESVLNQAIEAAAQVTALRSQMEAMAAQIRLLALQSSNDQAVTSNDLREVRVERDAGDTRVTAAFTEVITATVTGSGGLAERTATLEATVDTPVTGLSAKITSQGTTLATLGDTVGAMATQVDGVEAKTDAGTAHGSIRWTAISAESGVSASWRLEASITGPGGAFVDGSAQLDIIGSASRWLFVADAFIIRAGSTKNAVFTANPDDTLTLGGVTQVSDALRSLGVGANGQPYRTDSFGATPSIIFDDGVV